jgi:hypothetical protein
MKPITIEFNVTKGGKTFKEDSVTLSSADELFRYVAPGGGCEKMPSDLGEIQMMFIPPQHPNTLNPIADKRVTLQVGMVLLTGPFSTIVQISEEIIDKVGRGELSDAFLAVIGANH